MLKGVDCTTNHSELSYLGLNLECQLPSKCLHGLLNSDNLNSNFKKLDQYYQQKLSPHELDERHFIQCDTRNLTPCKFSPYARNSHINKQMPATP